MTDGTWKRKDSESTTEMKALEGSKDKAKDSQTGGVKMEKTIGLASSISIIVGSVIGSGIFVSPTGILKGVNSLGASLVIWVACGIFSLMGAYSYAELGTIIQRSGADYAYIFDAYGSFPAFVRLWVEVMIIRPATMAVICMAVGKYVCQPFFPDCEEPELAVKLIAILVLITLTSVNCISVKMSTGVQNIFMYAKLAALAVIITTGFIQIGKGRTEEFEDMFAGTDYRFGSIVNAFYSGLFAFSGWNYLNCMIDEMKNPKRDLPIAIVISCIVVTIVYVLTIVSYATVVSISETLVTPAVAVLFGRRVYGFLWFLIPIAVAMSCFGGVNGTMLTTSRIFVVAGQNRHMPPLLGMIHRSQLTPIPATIFTCLTAMFYLFVGDVYQLINCIGFVTWGAIALSVFIVIQYRYQYPNLERTVKVPLFIPIIYVLFSIFLVIFSFQGDFFASMMGLGILLTSIPVYLVTISWKNKPRFITKFLEKITSFCQKTLETVPSEVD